jgi:hypothetical protein
MVDKMNTKKALDEAQEELRGLLAQRAEIDRRIAGLSQIIQGLKTLGEKPEDGLFENIPTEENPGFTKAVRNLIKHSTEPLTPMEIRDELQAGGYGGKTPKHTLINVYTVISRLKEKQVISEVRKGGKPAYVISQGQQIVDALGF